MKALARSYLWWPQLESEIEHTVQQCDACQECEETTSNTTTTLLAVAD